MQWKLDQKGWSGTKTWKMDEVTKSYLHVDQTHMAMFANNALLGGGITVLSRASAHPPLLIVLWFFRVLCVTAHHANSCIVNPTVGPLSSHSSDALWAPRHQVHTHLSVAWFAALLPCSTKIRVLQATTERCGNLAMRLRVGPLLHWRASLNEAQTNQ